MSNVIAEPTANASSCWDALGAEQGVVLGWVVLGNDVGWDILVILHLWCDIMALQVAKINARQAL